MKMAVIADIHGNYEAAARVIEDIEKQGVDTVISLGDNIGYGADPEKVIQLVKKNRIISVLGNHELALLDEKVKAWFKKDGAKSVEYTINHLSMDSQAFIRSFKLNLSFHDCFFVHAFYPDSVRFYIDELDDSQLLDAFNRMEKSVCFVGHTHKRLLFYPEQGRIHLEKLNPGKKTLSRNKKYFINAGSVGQPRDGSSGAAYLIWDTERFELEIRSVAYDVAAAATKIRNAGLPERYARILEGET